MTDVPGHTRGLIAPLAAGGVTFLDIGVNDASTTAVLPPLFQWKDRDGASLIVSYHPSYGTVLPVPGADFAFAIVMRDDNTGPHTPEEIAATYTHLEKQFPNAENIATDLTKIADEIHPHADALPTFTGEIGDTWIHGVGSDPRKVSRYRRSLPLAAILDSRRQNIIRRCNGLEPASQAFTRGRTHLGHRHQNLARFRQLHPRRSDEDARNEKLHGGSVELA